MLHAGAATDHQGAVAFVGESGAGKSTLTGSLCAAGWRLVADDCVFLRPHSGDVLVVPSYPGLRLRPDAASCVFGHETFRTSIVFCRTPVPLQRMYLLAPAAASTREIEISRLRGGEAVVGLVRSAHRLDITDRARLRDELDRLAGLATRLPLYRLGVPRDLSRLSAAREAILAHLAQS